MTAHPDDTSRITADGVRDAATRIAGHSVRTPLIENEFLNDITGGRIFCKAEVLQHCGSFKFRGAFTRLSRLDPETRARGVLAWSSGNHGQGVARAAQHFGVPAVIIMPADAPALKIEKVRAYGAEIITYDRYTEDREAIGRPLADQRGLALAPSYDHVDIIEGQGTVALEACEELAAMGLGLDRFIVCCGGGGLTAGCATILGEMAPDAAIAIAEPDGFDETWASIRTGERHHADISRRTICDAIATPTPGRLTLPIMQEKVGEGVSVSEAEVSEAMVFAFKYLKLVLEPGGAVALAAVLNRKIDCRGQTTVVTLSGGNVDPGLFTELILRV